MTGFARADGVAGGFAWAWELRSVNGRGLELRFRLSGGTEALEPALKEAAGKVLKRGNVTANLSLKREEAVARVSVDPVALEQALTLATELAARIPGAPAPRAEALLGLPGVMRSAAPEEAVAPPVAEVQAGFAEALAGLVAARNAEGARLEAVLRGQLGEIADLRAQAEVLAADQPAAHRARLMENLRALLDESPGLPEERIAQEVALLAARSDVREELDRLASHITAAEALLAEGAAIGRRFDFLVQEFNREANTLCSKSSSTALTAVGLKLKAAIEQMREQVQNIE